MKSERGSFKPAYDVTYFRNGRPSAPNGENAFLCPLVYAAILACWACAWSRGVHENESGELGSRVRIEESTLNPANLLNAGSIASLNDCLDEFRSDRAWGSCARNLAKIWFTMDALIMVINPDEAEDGLVKRRQCSHRY